MARHALLVEYHGGPFAGWQRQAGPVTVQGVIEAALARLDAQVPAIAAAGRTDAGVHATGQVAQADLSRAWDPFRLAEALNAHLRPHPVAILRAALAPEDWHARFSAIERRYTYRIIQRRAPLVRDAGLAWHIRHPLDPAAMQRGADLLVGRHDFTTFRAAECQADSPQRTLDEARIETRPHPGGVEILFHVRARSFLHSQVRSMIGTLERVGAGAWAPERIGQALAARDRRACGPVAPPQGLTLTGVGYPSDPLA
jgi:tRNA pseudouridine38-40 synthase